LAKKTFLHIGAPKSGTTYLQTVLWRNRARLREVGVLVPGRQLNDYNRAAVAVRSPGLSSVPVRRTWRRLLAEAHEWPDTVVMSSEWFCLTSSDLAGRTVDQLGPGEVHVVYGARDLVTLVPAAWQETLKRGARHSLEEFIAGLDAPAGEEPRPLDDPVRAWSWWTLDPAVALARWEKWVGPENVHVVTVPPRSAGRELLFTRFASLFGFDPSLCDTAVARPNESLGVEAAELLRRVAPQARQEIDFESLHWSEEYRWLRRYLGHELLVPRGGSAIRVPPDAVEHLAARSRSSIELLRQRGYDVVGDLAELTMGTPPPGSVHPDEVTAEQMLELAVPVMAQMLARIVHETLRAEQAEQRIAEWERT
jgi:hypothetical protein